MMNRETRRFLSELLDRGRWHDAEEPEHGKRLLNLEPDTAQVISILLRSSRRTRVLEIGTSNGYSTIWLAAAVGPHGGRVTSTERDAEKQAEADANLRRTSTRDVVELLQGDATEVVAGLPGPFDCVFFDADRLSAPRQLALLVPKLTPDVLLLADNVLSHPDEVAGYLRALEELPDFERVVIPVGKGLSVAYRSGAG